MKYLLIIFLILTCNTPKLIVVDRYDEPKMNNWLENCISEYKPQNRREAEYYTEQCKIQAQSKFCRKDSLVVHGKDTTLWMNTPQRLKDKITNIRR